MPAVEIQWNQEKGTVDISDFKKAGFQKGSIANSNYVAQAYHKNTCFPNR